VQQVFQTRVFVDLVNVLVDVLGQEGWQLDGLIAANDHVDAEQGGHDADRADQERQSDEGQGFGAHAGAQGRRGDDGTTVALEQVSAHAGHVADVVADVVGDYGGIAGIVLGDALLDLANQVSADVGRLGVNAAAHTREQCDAAGAEAEAGDVAQLVGIAIEVEEQQGHADQAEADHGHAHDRAGAEGHAETFMQPLAGGGGSTHIGANRDVHAEIAGAGGSKGANDEGKRRLPLQKGGDHNRDNGHEDAKNTVLAIQEGRSALLNGQGDATHGFVTLVVTQHALELPEYVPYSGQSHQQCDGHRCSCLQHYVYLSNY